MRWPLRLLTSPKTLVFGLDISSSAIKLLALSYSGEQYCVKHYGRRNLEDAVMKGNLVHDIDGLAEAVRQLLSEHEGLSRVDLTLDAVIAIPDACTISRTIAVSDRLDDSDLEELVQIELEKFIPNVSEDICFDFKRVGPSTAHATLKELLVVATRMQHVQHRVEALRRAGLRVAVVDIESFAVQRALPLIVSNVATDDITLVLDLGACFMKAFFFQGMNVIFIHEEEFCGRHPEVLLQDTEMARILVYREGLLSRIKRAFQFFYAAHSKVSPMRQISLAGDCVKQTGLAVFLEDQLGLPTQIANPFKTMVLGEGVNEEGLMEYAPCYLTVCGLAKRVC